MKRIKRYNELNETNGPAYGKQETTIKGLKGIPLTTENPMITTPKPLDIDDDDISFSDEEINIEMEEPKPPIDRIKKRYKMKRTKKFQEMYENIGPASDNEFAKKLDDIKKQGTPLDTLINLNSEEFTKKVEPEKTKPLSELKVGDIVWCGGDSSFCDDSKEEIKKITTKYDEDSGEPYNVIWLDGDRKFDARHGGAMNSPTAYYIQAI